MDAGTWSAIAAVVSAIATVVYTIGTFFLWSTTRQALSLTNRQIENQVRQLQSSSNAQIISSHRDLFFSIIRDRDLSYALFPDYSQGTEGEMRRKWLGTLLINHCYMIFSEYKSGALSRENLEGFVDDAKDLFEFPAVRNRWDQVCDFHPVEFRNFINERVIK